MLDNNGGLGWGHLLSVFVPLRNSLSLCYSLFCQFLSFTIMPPKKHAAPVARPLQPNERARRGRLQPAEEREVVTTAPPKDNTSGTVSVDVGAISSTISAVLSQAIKTAFSTANLASLIGAGNQENQPAPTPDAPTLVDQTVEDEVIAITTTNGQSGTDEGAFNHLNSLVNVNDPRPESLHQCFSTSYD